MIHVRTGDIMNRFVSLNKYPCIKSVRLIEGRGEQLSIMLLIVSSLLDMFHIIYQVKLSR